MCFPTAGSVKPSLTQEVIRAEIAEFQKEEDQKRPAIIITSNHMAQIVSKGSDAVNKISQVAQEPPKALVASVDAAFFREEWIRAMEKPGTAGIARQTLVPNTGLFSNDRLAYDSYKH
ncbi:MAG: hypothetical protein GOMPHAMPRED_007975 [Gomphillus americanus]|uniref:Uncharacterized protein n=1 Tax=Gomphillus americanus TaxID=1940652 RepID=A0A8H3EWB9_9LECA|nr:MAG: hypothetical protein GOMPHAMPRED_007975 [Gomphillus americanus]